MRVPLDLREVIQKKEIKISLHTSSFRNANVRAMSAGITPFSATQVGPQWSPFLNDTASGILRQKAKHTLFSQEYHVKSGSPPNDHYWLSLSRPGTSIPVVMEQQCYAKRRAA